MGTVTPSICPPGSYCPVGTISSLQCPAGSYSGASGLVSASECNTCPAGAYCPQGQSTYTSCTQGKYNPYTGGTSISRHLFSFSFTFSFRGFNYIYIFIYLVVSSVKLDLRVPLQGYLLLWHLALLVTIALLEVRQAPGTHVLLELIQILLA